MTIILFSSTPIPYQDGSTALTHASYRGHPTVVDTLLEREANVNNIAANNVSYCDAMDDMNL